MKNPETNPFSLFFKTISRHYSGVIAIILVGSACYLWLAEKPVPGTLENLTLMVVSFLFGKSIGRNEKHEDDG
jgi:hypothetical protein